MHYFVLRKKCHGPEIERYDESKWNEIKVKVTNAIAVSTDFNDPAFDGYTKVVWDSVKNPFTKLNEKIWVTRYDDFSLMEKEAEKAIQAKKERIEKIAQAMYEEHEAKKARIRLEQLLGGNIDKLLKRNEEMDKLIPMETEEFDAIRLWVMTGCRMPAGKRIEQIKKLYDNMTWHMFEDFARTNFNTFSELGRE